MTNVGRPPGAASSCPRCGAPQTVQAASTALCPACLLAAALDGDDEPDEAGADGADGDEPPYQIVTVLARDADAVTYLARGFVSREHVALKIVDVPDAPAILSRAHEWKPRLASFHHPSMSQVVDAGSAGPGRVYLATEYIAGSSLDYLLRHRPLSAKERTAIARQLADALAAAHAHGLAHMRLDASHVKVATVGGTHATILGLGTSLIVSGLPPQPDLDLTALAAVCRELGVSVP